MNISDCRRCLDRPCNHDWESHARDLAAELAEAQSMHEFSAASAREFWQRVEKAEAAISRVRDQCETREAEAAESTRLHGTLSFAIMSTRDVLRALDGDE